MTMSSDYFVRSEGWAVDTRVAALRSRRVAWIVATTAVAVALFEAIALTMLTPLKTVQPITLLVDRQTGFVQAIDPQVPRTISADAALTQSLLAQYVTAREGFDRAIAAADYRKVALWSAERARLDYIATMPAANPASPFRRYPDGSVVSVRIKSVSRLSQNVALVRFDTQRQDRNGTIEASQPWVSVIRYRYVDARMSLEDRLINPLGFQVLSYRRDAEAIPVSTVQVPSAALPVTVERPARTVIIDTQTSRREMPIDSVPLGSPLIGVQR